MVVQIGEVITPDKEEPIQIKGTGSADDSANGDSEEEVDTEGDGRSTQDSFTPNFKYKVYDEERELPEYVHGVVTDKDREQQLRETYGKAGAFDTLKGKYDNVRKERDESVGELNKYKGAIQSLYNSSKNDLGEFFRQSDISKERVIDWVSQQLNREELIKTMPESERRVFDEADRLRRENQTYQARVNESQTENRRILDRLHSIELDQAMNAPDVHEFAQKFDSVRGQGSFKKQVEQYGEFQALKTKQYVSPSEAVRHVLEENKWVSSYDHTPTGGGSTERPQPKTMPNLGQGRGVSPVSPRIKSIDGIKKHYNEKYGS